MILTPLAPERLPPNRSTSCVKVPDIRADYRQILRG